MSNVSTRKRRQKHELQGFESVQRITADCQYFGRCGGCRLQDIPYTDQLRWKHDQVTELLTGVVPDSVLRTLAVTPEPDPWRYRNKMEFTFGWFDEQVVVGLHERGSYWRLVDLEDCLIAPRSVSEVVQSIRRTVGQSQLMPYHTRRHDGFWRHAVVRHSRSTGQIMVMLVTHEGLQEAVDPVVEALIRDVPDTASVYWGVNTGVSDVATPEKLEHLWGAPFLEEQINGLALRLRPLNFMQPNLRQAEHIYKDLVDMAQLGARDVVWDLYCGIGVIGLLLAPQADHVYGLESQADNIASAVEHQTINRIDNATFWQGTIEDQLKENPALLARVQPDLIVVDPPRAGLHKRVLKSIVTTAASRLIYMSCNVKTLAADLHVLTGPEGRYEVTGLRAYDMFPQTPHLETLVVLERIR